MGDDSAEIGHTEARAMLDIFGSVGATRFDVTWTNRAGDRERYWRGVILAELKRTLPGMLDAATAGERNVIVRPRGDGVTFIQLDDLKADQLARPAPAVFLALETSPGNYQAWVALPGAEDKDFARRVRKGTGADATASGATRVAGSLNFKDKHDPEKTGKPGPRVAVHAAQPGRVTTAAELDRLGLVAAPEPAAERQPGPGNLRIRVKGCHKATGRAARARLVISPTIPRLARPPIFV